MPEQKVCRFYGNSKRGCRQGLNCSFLHVTPDPFVNSLKELSLVSKASGQEPSSHLSPSSEKPKERLSIQIQWKQRPPVQRPVPTTPLLSIRSTEFQKLSRRFASSLKTLPSQSDAQDVYEFEMPPSDPDFPFDLEFLRIQLTLPVEYPSVQSSILIMNSDIPSVLRTTIQQSWDQNCRTRPESSLLDRLKWLDRNLEKLLVIPGPSNQEEQQLEVQQDKNKSVTNPTSTIKFIKASDLELNYTANPDSEKSEVNSIQEETSHQMPTEEEPRRNDSINYPSHSPHRGTQIRLSNSTLYHISLVKCTLLNMTFRCFRCKETLDVSLQPQPLDASPGKGELWKPCPTCHANLGFRFRSDLLHINSSSVGYLDLTPGIFILDMRPSAFQVTCDTGHEVTQGFKSLLRDVEYRSVCHQCHLDLKLLLGPVKFVQLSPAGLSSETSNVMPIKRSNRRSKQDDAKALGIVLGEPLPKNGTCDHYKKSYRWLRFPCCGKIYPCDLCHESKKPDDHEMLWANRMICGFCSKEQVYSQKTCACGRELTRKSTGGFWEGGQGTRDRDRMSRKDSHKFKGLGKTTSAKSERVGKKASTA